MNALKTCKRQQIELWSISILGALLSIGAALGQTASGVPFTAAGIRSITGKNVCDFQGKFPDQFGVYLDGRKDNAVHYQQRDGVMALFLLAKPTGRCGVVDAVLDLTPLVRKNENIEFKCYSAREGGTTSKEWGHVIGLADNKNGRRRLVKARLAWRVNIEEKRFEDLEGQSVTCDTSGYAD
jgi:hypothetical protein